NEADLDFGNQLSHSDYIYNGIGLCSNDNFINKAKSRKSMEVKFIHAGRLVPEKGADNAIDVIDRLKSNGYDVKLCVVGGASFGKNTETDYVRCLKEKASVINKKYKSDIVSLTGYLSHKELLEKMSQSDVFLYPAEWEEPFGMVIVEALNSGLTVIASKKGGMIEILEAVSSGYLTNSIEETYMRAKCIVTSPYLIECNRRISKEYAQNKFNWVKISKDLNVFFEKCF
ncbi:glycosyltransferase, partial [Vibrio vulnificus]|nr:glycosyltransferase [Vibrio vulnificus]